MTQSSCDRCSFPGPMRRLHAGSDLAQPNGIHQRADCAFMYSKRPPEYLLLSPGIASVHTCRWPQAGIPPIIEIGAKFKSP